MKKISILTAFVAVLFLASCGIRERGIQTGYVTCFSYGGIIWQTWEVEFKNEIQGSKTEYFSIDRGKEKELSQVIKTLQYAAENGKFVRIYYHLETRSFNRGDSPAFIDNVVILK